MYKPISKGADYGQAYAQVSSKPVATDIKRRRKYADNHHHSSQIFSSPSIP
jgi:hypothetical protein